MDAHFFSSRVLAFERTRAKRWIAPLVAAVVAVPLAAPAASAAPLASSSYVSLSSVSCPTATYCVAVGNYRPNSKGTNWTPLVEARTGTAWSIQSAPAPSGSTASLLDGVSCTSASFCIAVGDANEKGVVKALIESWNGTAWTAQAAPPVPGASNSRLSAVSCANSTTCVAVGSAYNPTGIMQTLAEAWNGKAWTVEATHIPPNTLGGVLSGVSCVSATSCAAVGSFDTGPTTQAALADVWNGTSWTMFFAPTPNGATRVELEGVSCATSTSCVAAGVAVGNLIGEQAVLEDWNGSSWVIMKYGSLQDNLEAISCASTSSCVAVGSSGAAEVWNGTRWELHKVHLPSLDANVVLAGVSCLAAASCVAVGWYDRGAAEKTLAEGWTGAAWRYETTRW